MQIENFPLAWRWTQESHTKFPDSILKVIVPLSEKEALNYHNSINKDTASNYIEFKTEEKYSETKDWLKSLNIQSQKVTISWAPELAISVPWDIFCEHWDDFCYPSSDDADIFLETGQFFLRWKHDELFEHDPNAL